ncbi:MAG: superoxide dismutase [bacterium]|nr:superoxide dismutase [bacterium]
MYELPKLPYLFQDLEPYIDTHTMGLHYHKHQQGYLNKLNDLLMKSNYDYRYTIEELPFHIMEFPKNIQEDILFNLGGVLNHNLYFNSISPNKNGFPNGKLRKAIENQFGSLDNFFAKLKENVMKLKGSGYTFLVLRNDGMIEIKNFSNQELPVLFGYIPLFNIDLWEHAYYINYENNKSNYFDNFMLIADFTNANNIYNKLVK